MKINFKNKNILFRADSSSIIGTGHIKRDLVLASKYMHSNIIFACINLDGNIIADIKKNHYPIVILNSNSLNELNHIIQVNKIDIVIIDHYNINISYETQLKTLNPNIKLVIFDDNYKKHHCDTLINHNIYAKKKHYSDLVPYDTQLLCGSKHTLLRDEFHTYKNKKYVQKSINILIAMGGADTHNLNLKILKTILKITNIKINIITTLANKNLKKLQSYSKNKDNIKIHINTNNVAKLMMKSTFGVITPSVLANEMYFLSKDFISIKTAKNQNNMHKFLKSKNYDCLSKFNKIKLENIIKRKLFP